MTHLHAVPRHAGPRVSVTQARARIGGLELAVPASAANLGPGFDTLAVALQLYLRVRVSEVVDGSLNGLSFDFGETAVPGTNAIERAFRAVAEREDLEFPTLAVEVRSEIPMQSGLGSSAAATVAGLRLYEQLAGPSDARDLLTYAAELEGHADNAAAALLGGFTVSCVREDGTVVARATRWPDAISFVVATPDVTLATALARSVLPPSVPHADAVFNLQRAVLLVRALETGDLALVREALRDRLHQPFRAPLVPGLGELLALDHPSLLGVCLSGAGPSILAWCTGDADEIGRLVAGVYDRLAVACRTRVLTAHQPGLPS